MTDLMVKLTDNRPVPTKRSHRKAKSGCRTCKVRKVKCDEGWPACRACVSTGRVCDGYGIWGGGGNRYEQRSAASAAAKPVRATPCRESVESLVEKSPFPPVVPVSNTEEHLHFQFFKEQTLARLPGLYSPKYNNLWESLLVQACAEEPSVMHAVLAISSAHRRKVLNGASRNKVLVLPDKQEEFLLRNYCKSIYYLQPKFHDSGVHAMRTTLITCLVFTYLELLRGTYKRAYDHLDGGLKVLADLNHETNRKRTQSKDCSFKSSSDSNQDCIDAFLTEAFTRLRVQMEFSILRSGMGFTLAPKLPSDLPTLRFGSFHEARHYLDRVFDGINLLSQPIRDGSYANWPDGYWNMILTEQCFMQGSLDSWLRSLTATMADANNGDELKEYNMLRIYHTMAEIMAATCLSPKQEVFDHHIPGFLAIVTQCNDIASNSISSENVCSSSCLPRTPRRSWPIMSWMSPLYYTAIKCRDHQIRTRALDLMPSFWYYEIVWDLVILNISNIVAREVIRMEDGDFFEAKIQRCDTKMSSNEDLKYKLDLPALALPEERRFDTVEMVLLDESPGSIQIVCRKWIKGRVQSIRKMYNKAAGDWTNIDGTPIAASPKSGTIAHRI
ncbi:hypothetical protein P171DRAFT_437143 [Karstenula rhodostoma CBS 690.94]|uniref:Zn(2)-C6 fungal-type domain-containing protein n=1 Tax=Karstenula rhodostoma CBS 690.94 TaxID=1392251 RepID=A0A9P4P485_9PLEO|nr:hypothetical protein P171DRAFT_437143 [Karstenula rhodostoma CBS 690.94]